MRNIKLYFHTTGRQNMPGGMPSNWLGVLFAKWLMLTAAVLLSAYIIQGITVTGFVSAFFAAAAIGVLNLFFKPILFILTLPINIVTFGLFTFVINALVLKMASGLIPGFVVKGFWAAVFGALIISIVNWLLNSFFSRPPRPRNRPDADTIDLNQKDGRWE